MSVRCDPKQRTEPVSRILERLEGVREVPVGWEARCPAHDDEHASLSVSTGDDGRALVKCHAGCEFADVVQALGLKPADLFPNKPAQDRAPRRRGCEVATYDYMDAAGALVFQVVRYTDPKGFAQRRPDGNGDWVWNLRDPGIIKPLYHLPAVIDAVRAHETVFVVEGERDVATLEGIGLVATCNAGGACKWERSYTEALRGAHIIILPDNDEPGRKHARMVAGNLHGTSSVKVVSLPDLPEHGDITNWLAAGHTREELLELVESAPEWELEPEPETPDRRRGGFSLTDLGNAERLIAAHGENLRFDVNREAWLIWNGKRWEYDATSEIHRLAMGVVRAMYKFLPEADGEHAKALFAHIKKSESKPRLEAMVDLAAKLPGVPVQAHNLDADPMLLNTLNGTVDLRTGKLKPHARGDLITKLAPVEYDPHAKAPRWTRFLEEVFCGDVDIVDFVRRMAGYLLDSQCILDPDAEAEVGELWNAYRLWCEETGIRQAFKQTQQFSRSLAQRDGIDPRKGTGGVRLLTGITLNSGEKTAFSQTSHDFSFMGEVPENTENTSPSSSPERELAFPAPENWDSFMQSEPLEDSTTESSSIDEKPQPTAPRE